MSTLPADAPPPTQTSGARRTGSNRRMTPRVAARLGVRLFCRTLPGHLPARTTDLGPGGACVETSFPFALDSLERIEVDLPDGPLAAHVEACWQRENLSASGLLTGVRFLESDPVAARLWRFVYERAGELASYVCARSDLTGIELDEALDLMLCTSLVEFPPGHVVYRQGAIGAGSDSAFLVYQGRVLVEVSSARGRTVRLETVGAGGFFGGMPLVAGVPHGASAIAEDDVILLELDHFAFEHLREAKPPLTTRIVEALVRRNATHFGRLVELLDG